MSVSVSAEDKFAALSEDKRELLKLLIERERGHARKLTPYAREDASGPVRLATSWAQERLWFMDHVEGASAAYNIQDAVRLLGVLDLGALRGALDALVRRHEVLRTVFTSVDGEPKQEILPEAHFDLSVVDLSDHEEGEREAQVRRHKIEHARTQFNLRTGPLIRGRLLLLQTGEYLLLVTMHHIISDGWSLSVIVSEFVQLYTAHVEGRGNSLDPLPIQYADYARWQRQWLQGETFEKQLSYWRARLSGAAPLLELPTDRPRPAVQSYRGERVQIELDARLSGKLKALARRHEVTLFMILYAGLAILLARLSGQTDVIIGTPIANRKRAELEGLIGFFVNSLALRVRVSEDLRISEFFERVREITLSAYGHQDVPFEKVVEAVHPQRSLSHNPLFQVVLALQNTPKSELRLPQLNVVPEDEVYESAMFDLHVVLEERGDRIIGALHYATDLFDRETIERWISSFSVLLTEMADGADDRILDLPILTEHERIRITQGFNDTRAVYAQEKLIHELFEEQVDRTPDATAVSSEEGSLTYAQLNTNANQLAWDLRRHGVDPDQRVGICVERSLEMVVGLLGILKAGGAYVPLDPTYPGDRLQHMLEDAAPAVLLIQERLRQHLPLTSAKMIALDGDRGEISQQSSHNLDPKSLGLRSDHLAYVIYTSGSTGKPKGAMNEHRALINRLQWMQHAYRLSDQDRVLQKTPFSFDVSVWEFFWTLLFGAELVMARPEGHKDPHYLRQVVEKTKVTILHFVPSMLQSFLEQLCPGQCSSIRRIICSGEELSASLQKRTFECFPQAGLANLYGPTEAAIDVTAWECQPGDLSSRVPIGRPIWNTQMYVLNGQLHSVPIGVVGELYIGGVGVGRGYLNRPELTAERFIQDPFGADPNSRVYRTGDLGRWRVDGSIEYLGRNDFQVKIRGFRIELGEIEAALLEQPAVRQAVVLAREDIPGEKQLVAYVVSDRSASIDAVPKGALQGLREEVVGEWESLYDETYGKGNHVAGPSFVGWNSSYTGLSIPEVEMMEWLNGTVDRIETLGPRKVLEIGCGVGLVLQRLAPHCEVYVGTDLSASAIEQLRGWTIKQETLKHVCLLHRSATEFEGFETGFFDTVVLNSVVQYFPDIDYLCTVIQGATRLLRRGGTIFVGDIRNLELLSNFHCGVQLEKAPATINLAQLKRRIATAVFEDKELVINPRFFRQLPGLLPGIRSVQTHLKRGLAQNELMRYRYDVVLQLGEGNDARPVCEQLKWGEDIRTISELETAVRERRWLAVRVYSIPNERLFKLSIAEGLVESSSEDVEVSAIRKRLNGLHVEAVDPNQFWVWGDTHGYDVQVSCGTSDSRYCFEVQMLDRRRAEHIVYEDASKPEAIAHGSHYSNDPMESGFRRQLIPQLREHIKGRLPEHMRPSAWVLLRNLPLTLNGKVDRNALPAPQGRPEEIGNYRSPRTDLERGLADLWARVLRVDRVGVHDNFFELGGHSLLGIKLLAKVAERFRVRLSVAAMFQYPTIEKMAQVIESLTTADGENLGGLGQERVSVETLEPGSERHTLRGHAPFTYTQLAHWQLYQLEERRVLRGVASVVRLHGRLKLDALRAGLAQVVRRHDALRTRVVVRNGIPTQRTGETSLVELQVDDLTALPEGSREAEVGRLIENALHQPISLISDPPFEVRLLHLSRDEHVLVVAMEHIISDAFSMQILLRELFAGYVQIMKGHAPQLPVIAVQYPDYARWLAKSEGELVEKHSAYWSTRLTGTSRLRFPKNNTLAHGPGSGWGTVRVKIDRKLKVQLNEWCRLNRTTLVMAVFSAYAAAVLRCSDASDTVIQFQSNGRVSSGIENTIGYFSSPLYLRITLTEEDTFVDLLNHVIEEFCNAQEHADFSFLASRVPRPAFARNTLFNWVPQGDPIGFSGLDGTEDEITCSPLLFSDAIVKTYDLDHEPSVVLYDTDEEVLGGLYFPCQEYSTEIMGTFARSFLAVLRALVRTPLARLVSIQLPH
jgi:amino acid adenylation domain-containing protein